MSSAAASSPFNRWATIRYELLNTKICDLGLRIEGSPIEPFTRRLTRELASKQLRFQPNFYLTDTWGCPNEVPIIGIPFYLADRRLARIEEEQTGEVENDAMIMMLLRHEAGHAFNYAYRLWEEPEWAEVFGAFAKPYREAFNPQSSSKQFVRHIFSIPYGKTYAQKHPDEDFAETFAVWLTPRAAWRRKYRYWPALKKLLFVDRTLRRIRDKAPLRTGGKTINPVERMTSLLVKHYGDRAERFRAAAEGYVDDKLREVFPPLRGKTVLSAAALLRDYRKDLLARMVRWSGLDEPEASTILAKLEDRSHTLHCVYAPAQAEEKLVDISALATALAMELAYTGRLIG